MNQDFTKVVDKHISILPEGLALREFSNRILINSLRYSKVYNREIVNILSETSESEENHRELSTICKNVFKDKNTAILEGQKAYNILLENIKRDPQNDYLYWKLADVYLRKINDEKLRKTAPRYYMKAIELNPINPDYYSYYGRYLQSNGDLDNALQYFFKADSVYQLEVYDRPKNFDHSEILRLIAHAYFKMKKFNEAINIFETVENKYKNKLDISDFRFLTQCYIATNRIELVKKRCFEYIQKYPSEAAFYFYLGLAFQREREFESAIKQYTEVIKINPNNYEASLNKGTCYFAIGKHDSTLVSLRNCINISPQKKDGLNLLRSIINKIDGSGRGNVNQDLLIDELTALALIFDRLEMKEFANKIHQQLERLNSVYENKVTTNFRKDSIVTSNIVKSLVNKGAQYTAKNQYEEGLKYFLKALELEKDNFGVNYNIGLSYYRLKKYNIALKYAKRSKELGMGDRAEKLIRATEAMMRKSKK